MIHQDYPQDFENNSSFDDCLVFWLSYGNAKIRYVSAYYAGGKSRKVGRALLRCAGDPQEHPLVRGQCLENLKSYLSWHKPESAWDRRAYRVVLRCLKDRDPNVRFWACYVAGHNRIQKARKGLRKLRNDPNVSEMRWTVGYEAREALKSLCGKPAWEDFPTQLPQVYTPLW